MHKTDLTKRLAFGAIGLGVTIAVGCGSANEDVVEEATAPNVDENGFSFGTGGYGPPIYLQPPIPSFAISWNPIWGYGGGSSADSGVKDGGSDASTKPDSGTGAEAGANDAGSATDSGSTTTTCTAAGETCLYQGAPGTCIDGGLFGYPFFTCQPSGPTRCTATGQRCYNGTEWGSCIGGSRFGYYCLGDSECSGAGDTCRTSTGAAGYCFSISLFAFECREAIPCTAEGEGCFDASGWGTCTSIVSGLTCWHSGGLSGGGLGGGGGYYYGTP